MNLMNSILIGKTPGTGMDGSGRNLFKLAQILLLEVSFHRVSHILV